MKRIFLIISFVFLCGCGVLAIPDIAKTIPYEELKDEKHLSVEENEEVFSKIKKVIKEDESLKNIYRLNITNEFKGNELIVVSEKEEYAYFRIYHLSKKEGPTLLSESRRKLETGDGFSLYGTIYYPHGDTAFALLRNHTKKDNLAHFIVLGKINAFEEVGVVFDSEKQEFPNKDIDINGYDSGLAVEVQSGSVAKNIDYFFTEDTIYTSEKEIE